MSKQPLHAVTHSGPFHADDVLAWSLIRTFVDQSVTLERTRDPDRIRAADLVFDVGGIYAPERGRFDHHQGDYEGPLSSAGMVLEWLVDEGRIGSELGEVLCRRLVTYVDDVDNGRRPPRDDVPCFAEMVSAMNAGCHTHTAFDRAFHVAAECATRWVEGIVRSVRELQRAREVVRLAMEEARVRRCNVLQFSEYIKWKPAYFEQGGATHPTEYVLYPGMDGRWHAVAIPPVPGSFAQKRPLPVAWAGLYGEDLVRVVGVVGAHFCHKNRFIAVFDTRDAAVEALKRTERWEAGPVAAAS